MSKTAVGLFDNPRLANRVVTAVGARAFPSNDIRILGEPLDMAGSGVMGIPNINFEVSLNRELQTIGASGPEAEAYVRGVRRGGVLVFARGSNENADIAAKIMTRHGSLEVEKLSGQDSLLPGMIDENVTPIHDDSTHAGRGRQTGAGARVFVW